MVQTGHSSNSWTLVGAIPEGIMLWVFAEEKEDWISSSSMPSDNDTHSMLSISIPSYQIQRKDSIFFSPPNKLQVTNRMLQNSHFLTIEFERKKLEKKEKRKERKDRVFWWILRKNQTKQALKKRFFSSLSLHLNFVWEKWGSPSYSRHKLLLDLYLTANDFS